MVSRLDSMARRTATSDRALTGTLQRLSSGRRIVTAADDAAGLSISERLRAQGNGSLRAQRNVEDGISLTRVADAALGGIHDMLQRARELAVRFHDGTTSARDKDALQAEAGALGAEARRVVSGARFNGLAVLEGGTLTLQIGTGDGDSIWSGLPDLIALLDQSPFAISGNGTEITVGAPLSGGGPKQNNGGGNGNAGGNGNGNATGQQSAAPSTSATSTTTTGATSTPIARIDQAIDAVSMFRGTFGALQNRLEHALNALASTHESLVSAESRIRDADMAAEVVALTRGQITGNLSRAMTAQARVHAHNALRLLAA